MVVNNMDTVVDRYTPMPFTIPFFFRFVLPPHLTLKNFEGLDLGKMDKVQEMVVVYTYIYV